ncbi:DPH3 [Mytilus coruscus]|uniref:Diphthamide biosynthesis protein 3 n=1 Tax=Mytilus coruscus TaxID=42192 RepID=A0A6J8BBQ3_MYTCO|nr:unnamed protein product [Mytilus coruscus]CAC5381365.1 DPH3 [Mytilus coruscus]
MSIYHDEVEIEDFEYDEDTETYYYPCPCGDKFQITKEELQSGEDVAKCPSCSLMEELQSGEDVAKCPSCSLMVKVIYDIDEFLEEEEVISVTKCSSVYKTWCISSAYCNFEMESKSTDNTQQNCSSGKDTMKQKVKTESTVSKQDSDIQGTTELLNPSVLDEVLAEKKLALMRSPEVMKFLQSQQAELAKQQKDTNKDDED